MAKALRSAPGMRERSPDLWELIVEAGRDPVPGRRRQVSRTFRGNMRDAKKARAELLVEATKGRHTGSKAKLDDLFVDWIVELERKGRSPNTIDGYQKVYKGDIQPTSARRPSPRSRRRTSPISTATISGEACPLAACTRSTPRR